MDFRLNAHDPRTGDFLYTLPRPAEVQIGDVFGSRGTLELTYSTRQARAVAMPTFLEVQPQVQFDGGAWEDVGPALIRLGGSHEDTDRADMRSVQFVGRDWLLGRARVGAGDLPLIDGKRPFYQATAGQILRSLILEAQDRGAADGIELGPFTATEDSAGNAWSEQVTIYYSPGLPIGDVLANLVEQGVCDYRMEGRTLHVYEPETTLGRDLTTGNNPVRVHGAITEAPVKYSLEDLANSALLIGEDGFQVEVNNPSAPDDYGRLEITIEQGGVNQEGTARTLIDAELQRGSREIREITRTQHAAGARFLPYRDYRPGDFVQAFDDGQWQRYRVREIQVVRDAGGWTVHTVLNDRLKELLLKLAEKTNGITNGSRGSGGDGTRPAPPQKPGVEPAAPQGLVIDQQVYLDDAGTARGVITAGWGEVTESTAGLAIDIGGYELWWRENTTFATWTRATATSGDTTVDQSPVILTAADGSAMEYQWRVRAVAQASNRPGPWSNIVTLTMTQDTAPPPPPSAPIVSTGFRIVTVEWDGVDENGQPMPRDFSRVRVYLAPAEDMVGARLSGSLAYPGSWNSETMPADVPVWVAMSAVDRVGNESAMTPAVSVTPRQLVDDEAIREELDGLEGTIQDAYDELHQDIENIVVDANGNATFWLPTEPDETTEPTPKTGDIWFNTSDGNKLHRFDGQGWVSASDSRFQTIQDAYDDLESDVDSVRTSVDGKNRITQSVDTPPTQYYGSVGDRWERMSSMGSGGSLISNWRWNGDVWVSTIISDAVLGNVDAAKIGTGFLDAARIKAGSISADRLVVGILQNLVVDPRFKSPEINAARFRGAWATVDAGDETWVRNVTRETSLDRQSFYLTTDGTAGNPDTRYAVQPESKWRVSIEAWVASGNTSGITQLIASFVGYRADGSNRFMTVNFLRDDNGQAEVEPGSGWVTLSAIYDWTAFDDVVAVAPRIFVLGGNGGDWVWFRNPFIGEQTGATLIEDGAITTDKISTGAITSDSGIFGTVDAGILNAGEIDAARIGAKTITTDKVLVGRLPENMLLDVAAETGSPEPHQGVLGSTLSVAAGITGVGGINPGPHLVGRVGTDGNPGANRDFIRFAAVNGTTRVSIVADVTYALSALVRVGSSRPHGTPNTHFTYQEFDADGASLGSTNLWDSQVEAAWDWTRIEGVFTPQVGAAFVEIRMRANQPDTDVRIAYPSMLPQKGATLIQDGAITTDKILANAITAGKIAALAIEADHIAANAVDADKISAGAIDGKIITGATVRTSAAGARVQLTATGLRSYDSSGSQTFSINATNGAVEMTGNLRQQNSQGTITVGPELFSGVTPSIRFSRSSEVNNVSAGIAMEQSGALLMYGSRATDSRVSSLQLARGASSATTGMYRWFSGSQTNAYLSLTDGGDAYVSSSGGSAYLRATTANSTNAAAWVTAQPDGELYATARGGNAYLRSQTSSGSGTAYIRAQPDGELTLAGDGGSIYYRLTSDGWHRASGIYGQSVTEPVQGMTIDNTGLIGRYGSSRRWKTSIETISTDEYEDALLSVEYKSWIPKRSLERSKELAAFREANPMCPVPEELAVAQDEPPRLTGMIAEELHDAGVTELVGYDQYGRPDSIIRENFGMALVPIIKRLRDRVDALETQLGATE